MSTKITVNGTTYDSVEAMPPEVRRIYEQMRANLSKLSALDGESVRHESYSDGIVVNRQTTVRKKFVVNGENYDDESKIPAHLRPLYEQAMKHANDPVASRNEIKVSFQMTGPGFRFGKSTGTPGSPIQSFGGDPMPKPIGTSSEAGLRFAFVLGTCGAIGLLLWLFSRLH